MANRNHKSKRETHLIGKERVKYLSHFGSTKNKRKVWDEENQMYIFIDRDKDPQKALDNIRMNLDICRGKRKGKE